MFMWTKKLCNKSHAVCHAARPFCLIKKFKIIRKAIRQSTLNKS